MTRLKGRNGRELVTPAALVVVLILLGVGAVLAGCYLMAGLAPTLIIGGAVAIAIGLGVDIG